MKEKLPEKEVEWVAKLAYIALSDSEKQQYAEDLSAVLGYIDELKQLDTSGVVETMQVTGLKNVTAEDEIQTQNLVAREEYLKRAPLSEGGFVKVKSVFKRD